MQYTLFAVIVQHGVCYESSVIGLIIDYCCLLVWWVGKQMLGSLSNGLVHWAWFSSLVDWHSVSYFSCNVVIFHLAHAFSSIYAILCFCTTVIYNSISFTNWFHIVIEILLKTTGFHKVKLLHLTGEMDKSVRCACQIFSGFHIQKADVFGTQCSCYITFAMTLIVVVLYNVHCLHAVLRCSPFYACRTSVSSILAVQKRLNWSRCRLEGGGRLVKCIRM